MGEAIATAEVDRQVRYNVRTDIAAQAKERARYEWTFLVVNVPTEITRIEERIFQKLRPDEVRKLESGKIKFSGGIHYDFLAFNSDVGRIDEPSEIYRSSKIRKDRDLSPRKDIELTDYLQQILDGRR